MRRIPVSVVDPVTEDDVRDLRSSLVDLRTLADVLAWLRTLSPPRQVEAIITQDEYTHEVIARYDEHRWLAFDTN